MHLQNLCTATLYLTSPFDSANKIKGMGRVQSGQESMWVRGYGLGKEVKTVISSMPGIVPRVSCRLARSVITTLTELHHLLDLRTFVTY